MVHHVADRPEVLETLASRAAMSLARRAIDGRDSGDAAGGPMLPAYPFHLTYDKNGSLINQQIPKHTDTTPGYVDVAYIYDAWNRLVAVEYDEVERARYDYNGLSWRIAKTAYMVEATAFWQKRLMYYNHNWQLLEEHIDDDFDDHEGFDPNRHMQYIWGPPERYIDEIVLRRQDSNLDDTLDKTWYHCTDTLFSTVAILDHTAKLVERVSYDAYGNARHHRMGDLNGDGAVDISDQLLLFGAWGDGGVGDLNRDGASDVSDLLLLQGSWGPAVPAGRISAGSSGTDNIIGYAGYVFNAEMHGSGLYTVRYRVYDPELSRWLTRDPLGYVDGMGLYEYVRGRPISLLDSTGLSPDGEIILGRNAVDPDARCKCCCRRQDKKYYLTKGFYNEDSWLNRPRGISEVHSFDELADSLSRAVECSGCSCTGCIGSLTLTAHGNPSTFTVGNDPVTDRFFRLAVTNPELLPAHQRSWISALQRIREALCEGATIRFMICEFGRCAPAIIDPIRQLLGSSNTYVFYTGDVAWLWTWRGRRIDVVSGQEVTYDPCDDCSDGD